MTSTGARVAFIACGAVAIDTKSLIDAHGWEADVHGIERPPHDPARSRPRGGREAAGAAAEVRPRDRRVRRLRHGGRLDEVLARYPAARPAGFHCFQWYAGELYQRFDDDIGIYFLTDWLVTNWDRAVIKGLGIDRFPFTKGAYFGNITRILFVRQHPDPDREAKAREIAEWMGKPLEIHDLGIEPLDALLILMEEPDDVRA